MVMLTDDGTLSKVGRREQKPKSTGIRQTYCFADYDAEEVLHTP